MTHELTTEITLHTYCNLVIIFCKLILILLFEIFIFNKYLLQADLIK